MITSTKRHILAELLSTPVAVNTLTYTHEPRVVSSDLLFQLHNSPNLT